MAKDVQAGLGNGDERTSAMGLWIYAECYLDAANCVLAHSRHPHREPVYLLYAHALEFALKAFLRAGGLSIGEIEALGRQLTPLFEICLTRGLADAERLGPSGRIVLDLLDIGDPDERYLRSGFRRRPDLARLRLFAEQVLAASEQRCVPSEVGPAVSPLGV